jgi:HD-GYP domain-containing protein (c-di-GMP phosphodiesterase class II)
MEPSASTSSETAHLRQLDPDKLRPGDSLPGPIRTASGRTLVRPGRVLLPEDINLLAEHLNKGIFGGPEWPEDSFIDGRESDDGASAGTVSTDAESPLISPDDGLAPEKAAGEGLAPIRADELRVGQRLPFALYNRNGALLIREGAEITCQFLEKLRNQGIFEAHVDPGAAARLRELRDAGAFETREKPKPEAPAKPKAATREEPKAPAPETAGPPPAVRIRLTSQLDALLSRWSVRELKLAARRGPRARLSLSGLRAESERASEILVGSEDRLAEISDDLICGRPASVTAAVEVVTQFMDMIRLDASLLPAIIKLKESPGEYLFRHGMNVAALSMSVASEFGLPAERLLEIGLGALLQDVGMMQVPEHIRFAPRPLTAAERAEISRHPLYTLSCLEEMEGLSETSRLIVYQSHERTDRSGYPRKWKPEMIHPFARLVGAVDAYVAMIADRPYRNARAPYEVMEQLLRETHRGRFDPTAARALLDSVSLFPIGSYVRLSNGLLAKVLRATPRLHTKPVVVPLNADGTETDAELDLSQLDDVCVVQALGHTCDTELEFFKSSAGG